MFNYYLNISIFQLDIVDLWQKIYNKQKIKFKFMLNKFELKVRKLIKIGGSFYLSIPSVWIKNNSLDKGSKINISLNGDGLLVLEPFGGEDGIN